MVKGALIVAANVKSNCKVDEKAFNRELKKQHHPWANYDLVFQTLRAS